MSARTSDPVRLTIDDEAPAAAISRIRWRLASGGPWLAENTFTPRSDRSSSIGRR